MLQVAEEGMTTLRHFLVHHVGKKSLPSHSCRTQEVSLWYKSIRQKCSQNGSEEPWQVVVLHAAEEGRKTLESSANLLRRKFLSDPRTGDQLFPKHMSKTCLLIPQPSGHAFQEMPKPYSLSTWSHLMAFQERPNAMVLISLGGKNPSLA